MERIKGGKPTIEFMKLAHAANVPPLLVGKHGVGKSELVAEAARELDIEFIARDLSLMEPPDLVGLPKMDGDSTRYLPPDFLPRDGKGILLFEELNRAASYMRAPCLQLLTARRLNDYVFPPGWLPAAAVNPSDSDYDVFDLDPALLSRFMKAMVVPDRTEWLRWARENDIHPAVLDHIDGEEAIFDSPDSNPRAWVYVSHLLRAAEQNGIARGTLQAGIFGIIGAHQGRAFLRGVRPGAGPLKAKDILKSYDRHRPLVRRWVRSGKLDLVAAAVRNVQIFLQTRRNYEPVRKDRAAWANLGQFVNDLPADLSQQAVEFFDEHDYDFPAPSRSRK